MDAKTVALNIVHDALVLLAQWAVSPWVLPFVATLVVAVAASIASESGDHPDEKIRLDDSTEQVGVHPNSVA